MTSTRQSGRPTWQIRLELGLGLLMAVVAGVGLLVVALAVWLWIALSGGVDDLFRGDPPDEGDAEVVQARQAAQQWFGDDASRVADDVVTPTLGRGVTLLGTGDQAAPCQVGQHNWKVDDDFDLTCQLEAVRVLAVPSRVDRDGSRVVAQAALEADGWSSTGVNDHRDAPSRWTRRVDDRLLTLEVAWIRQGAGAWEIGYQWDPDLAVIRGPEEGGGPGRLRDAQGRPVGPQRLVGAVPASGYAVVLNQSVEYFRE